ncbi:MAG: hypothetical protein SGJ27_04085 [Candidatus Melainabacteria bacterium]|nr:hypothetical protein [Candidatus Melainabacteria bacterium]
MKLNRGTRSPQADDRGSQCKVATAALANGGKPVLYMLLSTILLMMLCMMFSQSFGPGAWSKPQQKYKIHQLSHADKTLKLKAAHVMRI